MVQQAASLLSDEGRMRYAYKQYRRRNLPHIHSPGAILFVTFRLAGSIPQDVLREWKAEKVWLEKEIERVEKEASQSARAEVLSHKERLLDFHRHWFRRFEEILHKASTGPVWLKDERVAKIVADSLHYRDEKVYRLDAYCIMSNHVHVVFKPFLNERSLHEKRGGARLLYESDEPTLEVIMHSLKSYTAQEANKLLGRKGAFWESESYDHEVRNEREYYRIVEYVLNNPVKAGLVKYWREWRWSWKREGTTIGQPVE
jgi:REP element-mobilizing transposase RayT